MFDEFTPSDQAKHNGVVAQLGRAPLSGTSEVAGSNPVNLTIFPDNL